MSYDSSLQGLVPIAKLGTPPAGRRRVFARVGNFAFQFAKIDELSLSVEPRAIYHFVADWLHDELFQPVAYLDPVQGIDAELTDPSADWTPNEPLIFLTAKFRLKNVPGSEEEVHLGLIVMTELRPLQYFVELLASPLLDLTGLGKRLRETCMPVPVSEGHGRDTLASISDYDRLLPVIQEILDRRPQNPRSTTASNAPTMSIDQAPVTPPFPPELDDAIRQVLAAEESITVEHVAAKMTRSRSDFHRRFLKPRNLSAFDLKRRAQVLKETDDPQAPP